MQSINNFIFEKLRISSKHKEEQEEQIEKRDPKTVKVGDRIRIIDMCGEPHYTGKTGEVTYIDFLGQLHGTWGGCGIIPEEDKFEIL